MATHFSSETEWKAIKKDIDRGKPRADVMKKYDIGEKKYYRMRKSTSYENYKKLTNDATKARARALENAKHRELNKICREAEYDRRPYPSIDSYNEKTWPTLAIATAATIVGFGIIILFVALMAGVL